jgi:hypothetical protein
VLSIHVLFMVQIRMACSIDGFFKMASEKSNSGLTLT